MKAIKGLNSYANYDESMEFLTSEELDISKIKRLNLEYNLIRATNKIEELNIRTVCQRQGKLKFPLPYQSEVPFEVEMCCILEAYYMCLKKVSEELLMYRRGITSQSEKTASVTFDKSVSGIYKKIRFNNLEAYKLIEKYVSRSYRIK